MSKNWIEIGKQKGYTRIYEKGRKIYIEYPYDKKEYCYDDPEEKIRANVYVELIEEYSYPADRIKLEQYPPIREGGRPSL